MLELGLLGAIVIGLALATFLIRRREREASEEERQNPSTSTGADRMRSSSTAFRASMSRLGPTASDQQGRCSSGRGMLLQHA
jgi:Na+/glutamate symporter